MKGQEYSSVVECPPSVHDDSVLLSLAPIWEKNRKRRERRAKSLKVQSSPQERNYQAFTPINLSVHELDKLLEKYNYQLKQSRSLGSSRSITENKQTNQPIPKENSITIFK